MPRAEVAVQRRGGGAKTKLLPVIAFERLISIPLQFAVFIFLLIFWALVGFLIWIPILFYGIVRFTGALIYLSVVGRESQGGRRAFEKSVHFWSNGFDLLIRNFFRRGADDDDILSDGDEDEIAMHKRIWRALWKFIPFVTGAFLFWSIVYVLSAITTGGNCGATLALLVKAISFVWSVIVAMFNFVFPG